MTAHRKTTAVKTVYAGFTLLPGGRRRLPSAGDKAKGKLRETVSDEGLEAAGRTDQANRDVNQTGEHIKDVVKG
ncbi:hypothetical protein PUR59_32475 [Streptomyces sp. SP18ES09]|uniref:hypothetical protein n=1 Tax=Streptomyces sp. SP18ES09 TaxID=3002532 RepID=UPI002E7A43A3|nr:hypothetical protein [Streptomyces sp. SP18ES09]MEE1819723.1 hypothetical protein [Streptomyces sp. SP18ES09]